MRNDLLNLVGDQETILYEGKPHKGCFIFESIFNPLLPFAIMWGAFDFFFVSQAFAYDSPMKLFMIPFMAFHLMPVWLYLGGALFSFLRYHHTFYVVSDHAVYVSKGVFTKTVQSKPFAELSHVDLHRGMFDQWFGVGDIILTTNQMTRNNKADMIAINSIKNYEDVYRTVKKLQKDIYSDVMYPNDLRPEENHGYRTKYRG